MSFKKKIMSLISETGYMIDKRYKLITGYEYQAYDIINCIDEAVNLHNQSDGRTVYQSEVAEAKKLILESEAAVYKLKQAHELLRQLSLSLGYREVTTEDFLNHGAGGKRD